MRGAGWPTILLSTPISSGPAAPPPSSSKRAMGLLQHESNPANLPLPGPKAGHTGPLPAHPHLAVPVPAEVALRKWRGARLYLLLLPQQRAEAGSRALPMTCSKAD